MTAPRGTEPMTSPNSPLGAQSSTKPLPDPSAKPIAMQHADGSTRRKETPSLEGRVPLPEEITGRASRTDDDLVVMFGDKSGSHLTDGFRGGSAAEEYPVEGEPGDGVLHDKSRPDAPNS